MVVFVDYDQDSYDDAHHHRPGDAGAVLHSNVVPGKSTLVSSVNLSLPLAPSLPQRSPAAAAADQVEGVDTTAYSREERDSPNVNTFSAALSCYPYGRSSSD